MTVISVVRGGEVIHAPGPEHRLEPGDVLTVLGHGDQIDRCRDLLLGRDREERAAGPA